MPSETDALPLILIKLYRPRNTGDPVPRLMERLDRRRERPLTLVSARAVSGTDLITHSRNQLPTTIPSVFLALVVHEFIGFQHKHIKPEQDYQEAPDEVGSHGVGNHWTDLIVHWDALQARPTRKGD